MTDDPAFLRAIRERPDDDAPRLVYADWLDEHGQAERAEFIRVQCELARLPACLTPSVGTGGLPCRECRPRNKRDCLPWCAVCERHGDLSRRGRELLSEPRHFINWTPGVFHTGPGVGIQGSNPPTVDLCGKGLHSVSFRRGFIESTTADAAAWLEYGDTIVAVAPVRDVRLATAPGHDDDLPLVHNADRRHFTSGRWPGVVFHLPAGSIHFIQRRVVGVVAPDGSLLRDGSARRLADAMNGQLPPVDEMRRALRIARRGGYIPID